MSASPFLMAFFLKKLLHQHLNAGFKFDVIDAHYLYPDGVAAALLGQHFQVPVVLSAYGSDVSLLPHYWVPRAMISRAITSAAGVTTVCDALKTALIQLGHSSEKIRVILQGVDLDLFKPPQDRQAIRRQFGLDGPTLLSVGHLIPRKGHDIAIEALARLPGMQLIIVGSGPEEQQLWKHARVFGVAERVTFAGHVDQGKLSALFGAADVTVNCSDREGLANVLLESLACGTPVAATAVWGSPELITSPEAGVLFSDRSPPSVAEGVARLVNCLPNRAATRLFAEQFSWAKAAHQHLGMLHTAAATHLPKRRRLLGMLDPSRKRSLDWTST